MSKTNDKNFHKKYLKTKQFDAVRNYVFQRDGNKCMVCGRTENLVCHHRCYQHLGESNLAEIADCVTLCKTCHYAHHKHQANYNWYSVEHPRNRTDLKIISINDIELLVNEQLTEIYNPSTFKKIPVKHLKRNNNNPSVNVNGTEIILPIK